MRHLPLKKVWTDAEFMALPREGHRYELVNKELVDMGNFGMGYGYVACILLISVLAMAWRERTFN